MTGRQINSSAAVLERLGEVSGTVERELHACQVELITGAHRIASAAVRELAEMRSAVVRTGAGLLGSGTHPSADEGEAVITDKERYERIRFLLGDAVLTRLEAFTSMWECPTARALSGHSTGYSVIFRCYRHSRQTRRFDTAATPVSRRRAS